jgi:hypothetical protein
VVAAVGEIACGPSCRGSLHSYAHVGSHAACHVTTSRPAAIQVVSRVVIWVCLKGVSFLRSRRRCELGGREPWRGGGPTGPSVSSRDCEYGRQGAKCDAIARIPVSRCHIAIRSVRLQRGRPGVPSNCSTRMSTQPSGQRAVRRRSPLLSARTSRVRNKLSKLSAVPNRRGTQEANAVHVWAATRA